jgi:hypothetical protein
VNRSFTSARDAALALLNSGAPINRRAGGFLGQLAVDPNRPTEEQGAWLAKLLDAAGLPPFAGGGE